MPSKMPNRLKELVSKNKIRYQADGFDLDLAYIEENIIAMGFPAENLEGVYRNHLEDVQRFLEQKHESHYKIYNLCLEREYLPTKFKGEVKKFPFKDHSPPSIRMMLDFCQDVKAWHDEHKQNVAVIHCKAGKGRTGVMICAYLVYSKHMTADAALQFYGWKRTKDSKGVTIPSQRRYVHYFTQLLGRNIFYMPNPLRLVAFKLSSIPNFSTSNHYNMCITIQEDESLQRYNTVEAAKKGDTDMVVDVDQPCQGDIRIDFSCKSMIAKEAMFHFWFNTFFVTSQEKVCLSQFSKIPSRRAQDIYMGSQQTTTQINTNNQNNNNVIKHTPTSQFFRNSASHSTGIFQDVDIPNRQNICSNFEGKKKLKPEVKKELILKALMFMQKKHKSQQLSTETMQYNQDQVLTSYKSHGLLSNVNEPSQAYSLDPDLLSFPSSTAGKRPSSPKLYSVISRSRSKLNCSDELTSSTSSGPHPQTYKTLTLIKSELDKANKDKQHKIFPENFSITLYFTNCDGNIEMPVSAGVKTSDEEDDDEDEDEYEDDEVSACKINV